MAYWRSPSVNHQNLINLNIENCGVDTLDNLIDIKMNLFRSLWCNSLIQYNINYVLLLQKHCGQCERKKGSEKSGSNSLKTRD